MDITYLLAKRIRQSNISKSNVSARIIKIAILAVTIGIASILIAVTTGRGLQKAISNKTAAFNGHLVISTFENNSSQISINPFKIDENYFSVLNGLDNVEHYQKVAYKAGLIKYNDSYEGIVFKGIDSSFNQSIFSEFMIEGRFPDLKKINNSEIIISKYISKRLNINIGDQPIAYFKRDNSQLIPNQRRFKVVGIYKSDFSDFDEIYILGSLSQVRVLNDWSEDEVGAIEVYLKNSDNDIDTANKLYKALPFNIDVITLKSRFKNIFQWIALFDLNILMILIIMLFVGVINIATALLILIFERASMIGLLKTIGAKDFQIQKIFLWNGFQIIIKGVLFGNLLGLGFYFSQKYFEWIKLDPATYYVNVAPVELNFFEWFYINLSLIFVCLLLLWFPTKIISSMSPSKNIRKR